MTRHALPLLLALALAGCSPRPVPTPTPPPAPPAPDAPVDAALLESHNAERARRNLPPLTLDARLDAAAQAHSEHMARVGRMEHSGIGDGTMGQRIAARGYLALAAAENVAAGQRDPAEVTRSWMGSAPHRRNILGPYEHAGFGMARDARGVPYWTALFASPAP